MPDRVATGPVILEHILQIEERLRVIEERQGRIEQMASVRHKVADARYARTDQYIVGEAFNVEGTLKQTIEALGVLRKVVQEEQRQTRQALRAMLSDPGIARERNGN